MHALPHPNMCKACGLYKVPVRYRHLYKHASNKQNIEVGCKNLLKVPDISEEILREGKKIKKAMKSKATKKGAMLKSILKLGKKSKRSSKKVSFALDVNDAHVPSNSLSDSCSVYKPPKDIWGFKIPKIRKSMESNSPVERDNIETQNEIDLPNLVRPFRDRLHKVSRKNKSTICRDKFSSGPLSESYDSNNNRSSGFEDCPSMPNRQDDLPCEMDESMYGWHDGAEQPGNNVNDVLRMKIIECCDCKEYFSSRESLSQHILEHKCKYLGHLKLILCFSSQD